MNDYVLLVDDDPNLLRGLSRALRSQPYTILTARSADEAERVVKQHPLAVIVSDEQMPGRPGTEMLEWVANNAPEVVRIVLTGFPNPDTIRRAVKSGKAFRLFTKPFDSVELAKAILEGVERHHLAKSERDQPLTV